LDAVTTSLADTLQHALGDAYRVDRELGGGGMSRVFVAHDLTLDRDVVVKVLSAESTEGVSADRFRREIQLMARLQHPHVVAILSAGTVAGSLYYVMPFVAGETLRERITREGAMPVPAVVRLLLEVLDALDFAHGHGVVHRDIKPENVLLSSSHAVVADFGIAKALTDAGTLTSAGFALGTPTYMAPEQAAADPATDHRADLYSVGVLGYELLTGAPPFTGSPQQLFTAHLTQAPAPLLERRPGVPDALGHVIMRALAKDPSARPQSAREMSAVLDSMPTAQATRGSPRNARARTLRAPDIVAGAAIVVAAAVYAASSRAKPSDTPASTASRADAIAVMPLSAVSDTSLARLGQDLVVTLSTNLDGVGTLHTVDAATLLMRASKLPSPLPLATARTVARELGAMRVITGTLIHQGDRVRASVTLHRVDNDSALASASAVAAAGDITTITDSLTWGILQQVWRQGKAPSPVLAGLTTRSVDALRAFLDGERRFQRLDAGAALADYRRAFEIDSNFAQAYLRYQLANSWRIAPPDTVVTRRLMALKDRLPERDRLFLETSRMQLPLPERVARWKALAARFPDYPPILMSTADPMIHSGPYYGIPIDDARPYLDRLEELVPEHADTRFHRVLLMQATGTPDSIAASMASVINAIEPPFGPVFALTKKLYDAQLRGAPPPPLDAAFPAARGLAAASREENPFYTVLGTLGASSPDFIDYRLRALAAVRAAGIYAGDAATASTLGEGALRIARGDWAGGLRALRRTEDSGLPVADRMTGARLASLGAWLGALDVAMADSAVRRAHALPGVGQITMDRVELRWLDGLVAVLKHDEPRMRRAQRELLADTASVSRRAARSLAGLWLFRSDPEAGADTLKAVSDDGMRVGPLLASAVVVERLVVARARRKRGKAAEAERYLMWTDAAPSATRNVILSIALGPLVSYERGVALEEAGERGAAALRLQRLVSLYDRPLEGQRALVEDAKRRLAVMGIGDLPARAMPHGTRP
jgi:TolB-like protein